MGVKDIALARYFSDEERYADLINGFVYRGREVVKGSDIRDRDTSVAGKGKKGHFRKCRDLMRKVVMGTDVVLVGLENQDEVHYAMPIRVMLEDAAGYDEQLRRIQREHRDRKDLRGAEYVGRFARTDRVSPVVTIVLYYGKNPWDGPTQLCQLMDQKEPPDELAALVNDYKIHVLEVGSFEDTSLFKTDLREVFGFIRHAGNKDAEREFTRENQRAFQAIEEDAYDVIAALTSSRELEQIKEQYRSEGGQINMCEAIKGMIEDGRVEGRREGHREGRREGHREGRREGHREGRSKGRLEKAQTAARNMYLRGMPYEDAAAICEEDKELVQSWYAQWEN